MQLIDIADYFILCQHEGEDHSDSDGAISGGSDR